MTFDYDQMLGISTSLAIDRDRGGSSTMKMLNELSPSHRVIAWYVMDDSNRLVVP